MDSHAPHQSDGDLKINGNFDWLSATDAMLTERLSILAIEEVHRYLSIGQHGSLPSAVQTSGIPGDARLYLRWHDRTSPLNYFTMFGRYQISSCSPYRHGTHCLPARFQTTAQTRRAYCGVAPSPLDWSNYDPRKIRCEQEFFEDEIALTRPNEPTLTLTPPVRSAPDAVRAGNSRFRRCFSLVVTRCHGADGVQHGNFISCRFR
jgi:hypothetical protein